MLLRDNATEYLFVNLLLLGGEDRRALQESQNGIRKGVFGAHYWEKATMQNSGATIGDIPHGAGGGY